MEIYSISGNIFILGNIGIYRNILNFPEIEINLFWNTFIKRNIHYMKLSGKENTNE